MSTALGTELGTGLGTSLGYWADGLSELAALEAYLSLNLFSWVRADYRVEAAGKVTSLPDKVADGVGARAISSSHAFSQASGPNQGLVATNVALGQDVVTFQAGGTNFYSSSIAPVDWDFASDGAGFDSWVVFEPAGVSGAGIILSTSTATNVRGTLIWQLNTQAQRGVWKTGSAAIALANVGTLVGGTPYLFEVHHATAASPNHYAKLGSQAAVSGAYAAAPDAGSGMTTMNIGGAGNSFVGDIADILIANRVDATLDTNVRRYVALRYPVLA